VPNSSLSSSCQSLLSTPSKPQYSQLAQAAILILGNYAECAWQTISTCQFRPEDAANPHIGTVGALEKVEEARLETLCLEEDVAKRAVEALIQYLVGGIWACMIIDNSKPIGSALLQTWALSESTRPLMNLEFLSLGIFQARAVHVTINIRCPYKNMVAVDRP
jgi:hypothetical protein